MSEEDESNTFACQAVYLLSAIGECWTCKRPTRLFSLMGLPPFLGQVEPAEFDDDDDSPMLKDIDLMPSQLAVLIGDRSAGRWRSDFSRTVGSSYWMNHCEHCDAKQGDHFVGGPDGPFWPYDEQAMDAIHAERIEGPFRFESVSVGYSGAMQGWRDRRDGIQRPTPTPARKPRKKRA